MLPSDIDLVDISASIYDDNTKWTYVDKGTDDRIYWALQRLPGCDVVCFRGSITAHDWWDDLRAAPVPTRIGTVHDGFHAGIEKVWAELRTMIRQPVMITGHSLGAARSDILTGLMVADKFAPIRRVVFGEPLPGMADFAMRIKNVPGASYRNRLDFWHVDPVTYVPLRLLPPFNFIHPSTPIDVCAPPTGSFVARHLPFAWHNIKLYQSAVRKKLNS